MLPTWLQAYSKRQEIDEASQRRILSVSPATLDRVLRDCKVDNIHKVNKQTTMVVNCQVNNWHPVKEPSFNLLSLGFI